MADIETYLDTIANGVYGRDVRAAIVNAIRQCYADGHAGATDDQARQDIATIKNKIGTADISEYGNDMTSAIKQVDNNHLYHIGDYVDIGVHDWLVGFFSSGIVQFRVPLIKEAPIEIPTEIALSPSKKPYITAAFRFTNEFRSVGANGWKTAPTSSLSVQEICVTNNRGALWVTLICPTMLQPNLTVAFVSGGMRFTFTDGT